jgi:hypothetical protein
LKKIVKILALILTIAMVLPLVSCAGWNEFWNELNKNPNERICSFDKVQKESFFNGFNWDELVRRRIKPPFIPQITKLNEEKLLNNLMHKFVSFLEKDSIEHGSSLNINEATTSGLEIHSNNNASNKHDKTIVMTRLEEIDETWRSKLDAHTRKNWFEDF